MSDGEGRRHGDDTVADVLDRDLFDARLRGIDALPLAARAAQFDRIRLLLQDALDVADDDARPETVGERPGGTGRA
ncbi:MAG TPA: hypothetical protein VFQ96_07280 [Microbacteriaceae bacterium]|nr:hypothetical protein [Microbacteriaceae bacterium]